MTAAQPGDNGVTEDALLGGRVRLAQPASGYRAAIDPVLLAAAVAARAGERVLDAGAGVGAASLCLAARVAGCRIVGVERDSALVALFERNIAANGFGDRVSALAGDIAEPLPALAPGAFDRVMINPPYLTAEAADAPPDAGRAAAMVEDAVDLAAWLDFGLAMVRRKGTLTVIHRADRLDALLAALYGRAGDVAVLPLWPKAGQAARRVIVAARKGIGGPARLRPGLVRPAPGGAYPAEAAAVLRGGGALDLAG
jgi:tRNA1(Val) A37 N6-methylase TrmN6